MLERRPSGVRLTDAGELLVGHAEAILARLRDAEEDLDALLGLRAGRLRMSTLTSAAATIVPLAIVEFRDRLPDVELSVSMVEPPGVLAQLQAGDVDLALCNDERFLELPEVEGLLLFEEPLLMALPSGHRLAGRRHLRLGELSEERWMLGTSNSCPDADRFVRACHAEGFEPQIAFNHDDYTAILGFVAAGVGVAPVPDMVARHASPEVRICSLHGLKITRPIVAVMPGGYQSRPARAMVEVLEHVSARWQAADRSITPLARNQAA